MDWPGRLRRPRVMRFSCPHEHAAVLPRHDKSPLGQQQVLADKHHGLAHDLERLHFGKVANEHARLWKSHVPKGDPGGVRGLLDPSGGPGHAPHFRAGRGRLHACGLRPRGVEDRARGAQVHEALHLHLLALAAAGRHLHVQERQGAALEHAEHAAAALRGGGGEHLSQGAVAEQPGIEVDVHRAHLLEQCHAEHAVHASGNHAVEESHPRDEDASPQPQLHVGNVRLHRPGAIHRVPLGRDAVQPELRCALLVHHGHGEARGDQPCGAPPAHVGLHHELTPL
mmetsp:Transcript_13019/g.44052  ORF Transcript_13019/g.44052 Transcript_13019/m.44052 type:complete len:283 (+) Transcript_13019:228-1076(+)